MKNDTKFQPYHSKIALIGNYPPRQCGIATFSFDLLTALSDSTRLTECWVVALNDKPEGYPYPSRVRFEINQRNFAEYRLAADFLNMNRVDLVCLQHEYGIFGGEDGAYVLDLAQALRMPMVTTLHTVLLKPSSGQLAVIKRLAQLSDRLVVMSRKAQNVLREVYAIPEGKISLIPHGIPDVPFVDPNFYKDQYGVEGRKVILTFGLLSPGKGIETMIDALPEVIRMHPEAVYMVLGATHPHIRKEQGEAYRLSLQHRARKLGVGKHLIFHNRFVELKELCEFLGAADVYVTPYLNREQIVSGTLAYAMGSGKAVVSTPYWYASEMLADGRGRIVPFRDSAALAKEVTALFSQEAKRHAMRKRAYTFCRPMVWQQVAQQYFQLFKSVQLVRKHKPREPVQDIAFGAGVLYVPHPKLDHVLRLTDGVGILQHAKYIVPLRNHGYCTDDNARALIVVLMAEKVLAGPIQVLDLACTYLGFLYHAFDASRGRFRNFMGYDRAWQEDVGSEDSHGRAVWGLGEALCLSDSEDLRAAAQNLFHLALPGLVSFRSPRAWAFALVGLHAYLQRFSGDSEVRRLRERLSGKLFRAYRKHADWDWPWIEDRVTYANGKISQALLVSGRSLENKEMFQAGLDSLTWLLRIQTHAKGHFIPVGNCGWYPRGGRKARFDQQPIEALSMIEACREAYEATSNPAWISQAHMCLEWFLGRNDLETPLYDHTSGGCCDGLTPDGPNRNQGAESTLVCLLSLLNDHQLRSRQLAREALSQTDPKTRQEAVSNVH